MYKSDYFSFRFYQILITFIGAYFIISPSISVAQISDTTFSNSLSTIYVKIINIEIEGNRRTKEFIILNQLEFKSGDSILLNNLMNVFKISENNLINIGLFLEAKINLTRWENKEVDIKIILKERWYTIPGITFDIYDRNFNNWWIVHNQDIRRLQYGIRFLQQNIRGRDEDLYITALFGYAQRFDLGYNLPFINKKFSKGLKANIFYSRQRNIAYKSDDNKELFYLDEDKFIRSAYGGSLDFTFRPNLRFRQILTLNYNYSKVNDTVVALNNNYYGSSFSSQQYIGLRYSIILDYRDIVGYPLKGNYSELIINKIGIGILSDVDLTSITAVHAEYIPLTKRLFSSAQIKFKYSLPANQPYYNQRGLGYRSDYVSGYEYYVIDGQSFGLFKAQLKYKLFEFKIPLLAIRKDLKNTSIPFRVFLKSYYDAGYVIDNSNVTFNPMANSFLQGYGLGLDLATSYEFNFRFEYSINARAEHGLFLHFTGIF